MSRISALKLQRRIAEETQLLAEEKWLIQALNQIKTERNSLQIERLQLESIKMHAQGLTPKSNACAADEEPTTSVVNLMQNAKGIKSGEKVVFEEELESTTNVACNEETLDLTATNSVFDQINADLNMEEDEEDDDEMDVLIDMNMLMNGN